MGSSPIMPTYKIIITLTIKVRNIGGLVERLRHRPFTAVAGVRIPYPSSSMNSLTIPKNQLRKDREFYKTLYLFASFYNKNLIISNNLIRK